MIYEFAMDRAAICYNRAWRSICPGERIAWQVRELALKEPESAPGPERRSLSWIEFGRLRSDMNDRPAFEKNQEIFDVSSTCRPLWVHS
jgi:hypothetical protein